MATNIVSTTITTETGDYLFTRCRLATYTVKIELTGFQTKIDAHVTGDRRSRPRGRELWRSGTVSETVQVTGRGAAPADRHLARRVDSERERWSRMRRFRAATSSISCS